MFVPRLVAGKNRRNVATSQLGLMFCHSSLVSLRAEITAEYRRLMHKWRISSQGTEVVCLRSAWTVASLSTVEVIPERRYRPSRLCLNKAEPREPVLTNIVPDSCSRALPPWIARTHRIDSRLKASTTDTLILIFTSSSAIAEGPRDALRQLKSCQLLQNCTKNHIWLEGLPFRVV